MNVKLLSGLLLCTCLPVAIFAQIRSPRLTFGLESQVFIAGEMNQSFDFLGGIRGQYAFHQQAAFTHYVKLSIATDIGRQDANLLAADLMLGTNWQFNPAISISGGIGGVYAYERHRFFSNDGSKDWQTTTTGITGQLGVNFSISNRLSTTLFVKQIAFKATTIGLGLIYSI
ncbi:MAG: hypothetical protein AAFV07_11505 [Bacteroidota bacterium]